LAQLNVKLSQEQIEALRSYAQRRRTAVSWLIRDYIAYLLKGGAPISLANDELSAREIGRLAEYGGAFNWLADEPDLDSSSDGEPV
jgi:hypothetical protein